VNREPEIYQRLIAEYEAWNATMLPIDPKSSTGGFTGDKLADHYNNQPR
jgi:hypothetical protein